MTGMARDSGRALGDINHLRQSIADILTTPIGSRVMRRDYGSELPALIDQPDNGATRVRVYAATASALMRWEPRLLLSSVRISNGTRPGQTVLDLVGLYRPGGYQPSGVISIQVPLTF